MLSFTRKLTLLVMAASIPPLSAGCSATEWTAELSGSEDDGSSVVATGVLVIVVPVSTLASVGFLAQNYLDEHRREVRTAIARGAGVFVTDLAAALELPATQLPHLGGVLRDHRASLDAHLLDAEPFTPARVAALNADLRAALQSDPVTGERLAALDANVTERLSRQGVHVR